MLEYLKKEANKTRTENGAATYLTTHSDCLDLFASIGALRSATDGEVIDRFVRAYAEDPDLTMKTLFEYAKQLFEAHGYTLPRVVFWNVQSRNRQQPVIQNEQGVALVSGCTPRIFNP